MIGDRKIAAKVANEMRPIEKAELEADGKEEEAPTA